MKSRTQSSLLLSLVPSITLFILPLLAGGCLVSADSKEHHSGNYVAASTFDQIKPGETSASWVRATLGSPTTTTELDDGTSVWKYTYTEQKESSGAVFLIFAGHDSKTVTKNAFVELKKGVVTKKWRE